MKNPLKNKIFFKPIWLFGQNSIGYLANVCLVIRLSTLTKSPALALLNNLLPLGHPRTNSHVSRSLAAFYIFHPAKWCLVVGIAYELLFGANRSYCKSRINIIIRTRIRITILVKTTIISTIHIIFCHLTCPVKSCICV